MDLCDYAFLLTLLLVCFGKPSTPLLAASEKECDAVVSGRDNRQSTQLQAWTEFRVFLRTRLCYGTVWSEASWSLAPGNVEIWGQLLGTAPIFIIKGAIHPVVPPPLSLSLFLWYWHPLKGNAGMITLLGNKCCHIHIRIVKLSSRMSILGMRVSRSWL